MNNPDCKLLPVVPYALGPVSVQRVTRVTVHCHVAAHAAIVETLQGWGYVIVASVPTTIGGLETITAEQGARELNGTPHPRVTNEQLRDNLASAIKDAWEQIQRTVVTQGKSNGT